MLIPEKYVGSALAVVAATIVLALLRRRRGPRRPPYPPGPKGYPIIGNVLDFPKGLLWEEFAKMAEEYDTDILHLKLPGSHLVVLNGSNAATELLDRRSVIYCDRPRLPMANELMGGGSRTFFLMRYGSLWRTHRRLIHRFFSVSNTNIFDDKIYQAAKVFLRRLLESPERCVSHASFLAGYLSLSVAYGMDIKSEKDKFYSASKRTMDGFAQGLMPGTFLVDSFPILKYVPDWFPGAGFKKFAKETRKGLDNSMDHPFQYVKETLQSEGPITSSIVGTCLEELPELAKQGADEGVIRDVSGTIFLAGVDTTSSAIKSFLLEATRHPEIMRLGQRELDEVLGGERLPELSDMPRLPFVWAISKEVLRMNPPVPLGAPHRLMEDDIYEGKFIPAGTTIVDNVWAMLRNEAVYPDPNAFNPGRFLKNGQVNPEVKDPEQVAFGYGRRICPGKYFASRILFLTIAHTLATFDISPSLDEDGNPIIPKGEFGPSLFLHPLPFETSIKPRSAQAISLITGN